MPVRLIANLLAPDIANLLDARQFEGSIEPRSILAAGNVAPIVHLDSTRTKAKRRAVTPATFGFSKQQVQGLPGLKSRPAPDTYCEGATSVKLASRMKAAYDRMVPFRRGLIAVTGYLDAAEPNHHLPQHENTCAVLRRDGGPMLIACTVDYTCDFDELANPTPEFDAWFAIFMVPSRGNDAVTGEWMPAILGPNEVGDWLDGSTSNYDAKRLSAMLRSTAEVDLCRHQHTDVAGVVATDVARLLRPLRGAFAKQ
jgi:putative SOS response-associated peptidase YedK